MNAEVDLTWASWFELSSSRGWSRLLFRLYGNRALVTGRVNMKISLRRYLQYVYVVNNTLQRLVDEKVRILRQRVWDFKFIKSTVNRYLSRWKNVKFEIRAVNGSPVGTLMFILVLWIQIRNIFGYKNWIVSGPGSDPIGHITAYRIVVKYFTLQYKICRYYIKTSLFCFVLLQTFRWFFFYLAQF